jgi:crossover junction endodeoxyribonuclease RusA
MNSIDFAIVGLPIPQGSHRCRNGNVVPDNGPTLMKWRTLVAHHARQAMPDGWDRAGPFGLAVSFWFPRPLSHHINRDMARVRPTAPTWHTQTPDVDKLARAVADALTTARVWKDDRYCVYLSAEKSWDAKGWARIVVRRMDSYGNQQTKGTEPDE